MKLKDIKLKTLLIFPPLASPYDYADVFQGKRDTPPLGIALLAGYLKKRGYKKYRVAKF